MRRGDVVRVADGKPRPAVIVQSDDLPTPEMLLICPLTSYLTDAPIYRIMVKPDARNGLLAPSQLMADRTGPIRRDRIDGVIGRLTESDLDRLATAPATILDLGHQTALAETRSRVRR